MDVPSQTSVVEVHLDGDLLGRVVPVASQLEVEYKVRPREGTSSHRLEITAPGGLVLRRMAWGHRVRKEPLFGAQLIPR